MFANSASILPDDLFSSNCCTCLLSGETIAPWFSPNIFVPGGAQSTGASHLFVVHSSIYKPLQSGTATSSAEGFKTHKLVPDSCFFFPQRYNRAGNMITNHMPLLWMCAPYKLINNPSLMGLLENRVPNFLSWLRDFPMTVLCAISRLHPSSDWRNHIILSGFPVSSRGSENQFFLPH